MTFSDEEQGEMAVFAGYPVSHVNDYGPKDYSIFSKIQLLVYYQCCILIGWATTRLYVIAH